MRRVNNFLLNIQYQYTPFYWQSYASPFMDDEDVSVTSTKFASNLRAFIFRS